MLLRASDSNTNDFRAKTSADDPAYKNRVAEPIMNAVDGMPKEYRELVHDFGYVDVSRAWRRGMQPSMVRQRAAANGGRFEL